MAPTFFCIQSELEIEPRYPLLGGWKATFIIGYGLPLQDVLFEADDGKRYLNFSFGCPIAETVVNKITNKVVLPEGSKNPSVVVPFSVERRAEVVLPEGSKNPSVVVPFSVERRAEIDLASHIIRVALVLKVQNDGASPASDVLLAFPPSQAKHLALLQADEFTGKKKKKTLHPLDVKPSDQADGPNGAKFFSISLRNPLSTGGSVSIEVSYILTQSLEPFPVEISQSEAQLVLFRDSSSILSPYPIKQQTTVIRTPSTRVESFTRVEPSSHLRTELKYGPYENKPAFSYTPILVHFENNNPFAVVEELVREIEISHWGNLQITEHYTLVHNGARHKGGFSRVEYQSRPAISGVSSFKHLVAKLPPRVHSVYYRDSIGNISTSHLRTSYSK
nr:dolichyl-diphosphooligosaccharide--protein glycosyltransferase subunit 1B [Tanacetum cinerariifolium]